MEAKDDHGNHGENGASMYGIFTYIWYIYHLFVAKCDIKYFIPGASRMILKI